MNRNQLSRSRLTFAIKNTLLASASVLVMSSFGIQAAEDDESDDKDNNKIIVTGSRLKQSDYETAAPVHVITAQEIEANGFTTAFEALQALTQVNGSNQGAQDGGTFTQGADSLNLRAIGPGRTLTLVNGRRMADYPLPFNGQSNIVNVANIPSVMIDRIEVLSSGASAIYGSDAVAGVFNIILKDNVEGMNISARIGDTSDGGGESYRLQFVAGHQTDKLNLVLGLEVFNREPIFAYERDYIDSFNDNPDVINGIVNVVNSRSFLILDPFDGNGDGFTYIDPTTTTCEPLTNLAQGTVEYSFRAGAGNYCGTANDIGFSTIRNAKENYTGYLNLSYELSSAHQLFSTLILTDSETEFDAGTNFWQYSSNNAPGWANYVLNSASTDHLGIGGQTELWQRIFTPEEVDDNSNHSFETAINLTVGARGDFLGDFEYEAALSVSTYDLKRERRLIDIAAADLFFLGPVISTTDFGAGVWNVHNAPSSNMYRQLTTDEYRSISGIDTTRADSKNSTVTFVLTNEEIFDMPAGEAGLALVLEAGSQEYDVTLDPKLVNQEWFGFTGTGGGGERDRFAFGAELSLPLTENLIANMAARWDKYDDATNVDDATTFNIGLEYRPFDNLLLRATLATSFRAPDMHFVYADPSGFFQTANDQYLCRVQQLTEITTANGTADFNQCTLNIGVGGSAGLPGAYSIMGNRQGSTFLKEEEGESSTIGFVYNITEEMSISVDYYEIELENVVLDRSTNSLLELEANCRLGQNFSGTESFEINSAECQNVLTLVTRNAVNVTPTSQFINQITTGPINAALRETAGYDVEFKYRLPTDSLGDFTFKANYNLVDKDNDRQFAGDDLRDLRENLQFFNFRSQVNLTANWRMNDWSTTIFARRNGSLPNWAETGRCCETTLYNMSIAYQANDDWRVGLFVRNLLDENPQTDQTFNTYPYYSTGQYDAYGREYSLQVDYSFGT